MPENGFIAIGWPASRNEDYCRINTVSVGKRKRSAERNIVFLFRMVTSSQCKDRVLQVFEDGSMLCLRYAVFHPVPAMSCEKA